MIFYSIQFCEAILFQFSIENEKDFFTSKLIARMVTDKYPTAQRRWKFVDGDAVILLRFYEFNKLSFPFKNDSIHNFTGCEVKYAISKGELVENERANETKKVLVRIALPPHNRLPYYLTWF